MNEEDMIAKIASKSSTTTWGTGTYASAEDTSAGAGTDSDVFYGWETGPGD